MEIIHGLDFKLENSSISLGKFDGLHKGHRLLLDDIKKQQGIPTVFTFEMADSVSKIYTQQEKNRILENLGMEREIIFPFTEETKKMTPEEFIREILVKRLDVRYICVGADFHFGKNRSGDIHTLEKYQEKYGYELHVFPKLKEEDEIISSTRIRSLMEEGNIRQMNALLGEPYFMMGNVVHGNALGRTIQMPTANIIPDANKKLLPFGVYASIVEVNQKSYYGVTNNGKKPTIGNYNVGVETYIMDFNEDIYDQPIKVSFFEYLRTEERFPNLTALRRQLQADKQCAEEILSSLFPKIQ